MIDLRMLILASPIAAASAFRAKCWDLVEGKLDLDYRELGRQNLKNIVKASNGASPSAKCQVGPVDLR